MPPVSNPLPYVSKLDSREIGTIVLIVIHCTETPTLASARSFGEIVHYADDGSWFSLARLCDLNIPKL